MAAVLPQLSASSPVALVHPVALLLLVVPLVVLPLLAVLLVASLPLEVLPAEQGPRLPHWATSNTTESAKLIVPWPPDVTHPAVFLTAHRKPKDLTLPPLLR